MQTLLGAAGALTAFGQQAKKARKPNFVIILADDLGYGDVGCFGSPDVPTPNIDSIARNGYRFTDGYVSAAVCSPSRAGLLTGRCQQRFGHEFNTGPAHRDREQHLGLPLGEVTLPQLLKPAGYKTGMVGKWHLGMSPEFHPLSRGFDEYFGFLFGANSYLTSRTPGGQMIRTGEEYGGIPEQRREPVFRGREPVAEDQYLTDAFGREAVSYIERHKGEPFFLYLAFNAVHEPLQATTRYLDRFANIKDERHRMLAAMTAAMDDSVGAVLRKLRDAGLEKDTLVFFLSDNGCPIYTRAGTNGPLSGSKITYFEGGIRVPFAVQWPGVIPAGRTFGKPVVSRDILPTLVAAAGASLPKDREYDGVNLLPYLTGRNNGSPHEILFWRSADVFAARKGNWKLIQAGETTRLYDLSTDLGEKKDRAGSETAVVREMREALKQWNKKLVPPRWKPRSVVNLPVNGEKFMWSV
ncbi:MAG: sulfatase-like hydrolase/transferase [Acidobacteria bacterium]|nr:sulfatase-like hydrolase/transferase [Acidobacteriota bacterium]